MKHQYTIKVILPEYIQLADFDDYVNRALFAYEQKHIFHYIDRAESVQIEKAKLDRIYTPTETIYELVCEEIKKPTKEGFLEKLKDIE